MNQLKSLTAMELLGLHARVSDELRERGVIRSANNPTGDLAEFLFCRAYGWILAGKSHPAADATGANGTLYQIKGRRMTRLNRSRQLGALRSLSDCGFQFLAAVLFEPDYAVHRAVIIPHALLLQNSRYIKHTNSWKFLLRDAVWDWPEVRDVTNDLRKVSF